MTLREFQLGKFTLLALLAHLEFRDGTKLGIKPWEGIAGGESEATGGASNPPIEKVLKWARYYM